MKMEHLLKEDKASWGPGPWQDEPDRVEWHVYGFPCLALRNPNAGVWCGYVGVPPGHRYHGIKEEEADVEVHGGLTYAAPCQEDGPICHVPQPGEPDDVWWLGFDCAHFGDFSPGLFPGLIAFGSEFNEYRTLEYVREETEDLARQLATERAGGR